MKLLIVVPTYNESLNLPPLVDRILDVVADADILVVDDGSPDGTANVARQLREQHGGQLHLLERAKKSGRGGAVLAGLKAGIGGDVAYDGYVEMDADLSHRPEELPLFITAASEGTDVIVGSRYLPGAAIEGWSWRRRVWSRLSNRLIKMALNVPISDFTNGYRLYSPRAVHLLTSAPLRETGYITLSEWVYVLHAAGMPLAEVPTTFINRRFGTSNMSAGEALDALRGLIRMRRRVPAGRN